MSKREGEAQRKLVWLKALDDYCDRHAITIEQFVSIFTDTSRDATWRSLFWSSGEPYDWLEELKQAKENNELNKKD